MKKIIIKINEAVNTEFHSDSFKSRITLEVDKLKGLYIQNKKRVKSKIDKRKKRKLLKKEIKEIKKALKLILKEILTKDIAEGETPEIISNRIISVIKNSRK